jgi:hypothetical protein
LIPKKFVGKYTLYLDQNLIGEVRCSFLPREKETFDYDGVTYKVERETHVVQELTPNNSRVFKKRLETKILVLASTILTNPSNS